MVLLFCEKCKKKKLYISSDKLNAWCQGCRMSYAYIDGLLICLDRELGNYPLNKDGTISRITIKQFGDKIITEKERFKEIEESVKSKIIENNMNKEINWDSEQWWNRLSRDKKIKIYQNNK